MNTRILSLRSSIVASAMAVMLSASVQAADASRAPGYVDLGKFAPAESGGEFVEVNIHKNLLQIAARFVDKEEPAVAELLRGIESVRVNVVSLDDKNRAELEKRIEEIRAQLEKNAWQQVVTVHDHGEKVAVYLKLEGDEAIQGVTVLVIDDKDEAVFVNIVGSIRPEQIATLGERLGIDPLKELHLEHKTAVEKNG